MCPAHAVQIHISKRTSPLCCPPARRHISCPWAWWQFSAISRTWLLRGGCKWLTCIQYWCSKNCRWFPLKKKIGWGRGQSYSFIFFSQTFIMHSLGTRYCSMYWGHKGEWERKDHLLCGETDDTLWNKQEIPSGVKCYAKYSDSGK